MIFRIKFISDEVDGFLRELKIDSDASFLDLNKAILAACGYPDDQMTSFYLCDEEWQRGIQVTREDMGVGASDEDIYIMESTRLSELIEDEGQRLEFVFDPFADRCFYLDVKESIPGESLSEAVVTRSKGKAPVQLEDLDLGLAAATGKKATAGGGEDDLFAEDSPENSSYNDDELDLEGFEISDGKPY